MNTQEAVELFLSSLTAGGKSPLTIEAYRRVLQRLVEHVGDCDVSTLTAETFDSFAASPDATHTKDGRPLGDAALGRVMAVLRSFGRFLEEEGLSASNPARHIKVRRPARKEPVHLTPAEKKRLIKAISERSGDAARRDLVIVELMLGTGIRLSELVGLDVSDVDLDAKRIRVKVKGGRVEHRFLNARLRRILRAWLRLRRDQEGEPEPLFLSSQGTRLTARQVQRRFRTWLAWAGIDREGLTVHSLRHTFATELYGRTRNLLLVSRALGHSQVSTTQIYTHLFDHELEDALEDMG